MDEILIISSDTYDAYYNLALEEYILSYLTEENRCILFLWQNDNAVIVGRNQNAKNECDFDAMKKYGTKLVRRSTGGGAVFHDLGNLNFSIICPKEMYEVKRSIEVVKKAVSSSGIAAEYSGRNDLLAKGSKFSGNAFLVTKTAGLHHGTILVDTDFNIMEKVLKISKEKLEPKGIDSVRSRVINLKSICPAITIDEVSKNIIYEFQKEYQHDSCRFIAGNQILSLIDNEKMETILKKYVSEEWNFGKNFNYNCVVQKTFLWGRCEVRLLVCDGVIKRICIYTDALFPDEIEKIEKKLDGASSERLKRENISELVSREIGVDSVILRDIFSLIYDM